MVAPGMPGRQAMMITQVYKLTLNLLPVFLNNFLNHRNYTH